MLAEATRAVGGEDWETARAALDRLGTQPADPAVRRQALVLGKRVDTERRGALAFARFDEAQNAKNYAVAVARYGEIPGDSVYKTRARSRFDELKKVLLSSHYDAALQALGAGRCADVKAEAAEIAKLDPQNTSLKEAMRTCRPHSEPVASAAPHAVRARSSTSLASQTARADRGDRATDRAERAEHAEAASRRAEPVAAAEPEADADTLMKQAREAWVRQQCGSALDLSRKALRAKPGLTDAYQIIAACSCSLKDADGASRAYAKLDERARNLVHTLCQRNGIAVGD
jgi:hypothetical protein